MAGARRALIVASDSYADAGLRGLRAPASDARALASVLQDPEIGAFEVRTLLNAPAHEVNLAVEEFFSDRRPEDLLLLHFSCHGIKDEGGELHFAMADTKLSRLGATAVAAEFVNRQMSRTRSRRVVLLLDCCYAGAFERGLSTRAGEAMGIESQLGGRGRAVITASSAMEYAFEGGELTSSRAAPPSVFTSALVEGLQTGDADRDQDGRIALDELYDYIYDKVRAVTPYQTPGKWAFGIQGELVIARRARPVTVPVPLPAGLQEAIDSPLAGVRAAVIQELARLLHGQHAGRALAARAALEQLAGDDSRAVAAAAATALGPGEQSPPPASDRPALAPVPEEASPGAPTDPQEGEPVPGQRHRPSRRAVILAGSGTAAAIVAVTVSLLALPHAGAPPSRPHGGASPSPALFTDDFSSAASGWADTWAAHRTDGYYWKGAYRLRAAAGTGQFAEPTQAPHDLGGQTPLSLAISVDAHRIAGPPQSTAYGIECRSDGKGDSYDFAIKEGSAAIIKWVNGAAKGQVHEASTAAVRPRAANRLRAACATTGGGRGVRLQFWVNGVKVVDWTDRNRPYTTGFLGLTVEPPAAGDTALAEFDNFSVARL